MTYEGSSRVERFPVPRVALREAVLNALIHRDYMVPVPVQIRVYDDKLVLWNPAVLPEGWTQKTLLAPHQSHPPNPDLANTFFRAGEIEAWGRGIERIFAACKEAGIPKPRIRFDAGLWTEFAFSKEYLALIHGNQRRATVEATGSATPEVTPHVTPYVTPHVTAGRPGSQRGTPPVTAEVTAEVRLLRVMTKDLTRLALRAALGLKHDEHFRRMYLLPALESGLIEMTIPDKPTSRRQKYRITAAGRALIQANETKGRPR